MAWFDPYHDLSTASLSTVRLFDSLRSAREQVAQRRAETEAPDPVLLAAALQRVGQLTLALGLGVAAVEALTEAATLSPSPETQHALAWAYRLTGQYTLAGQTFDALRQKADQDRAVIDLGLAFNARDSGQWLAALELVDSIGDAFNAEPMHHYDLMTQFIKAELSVRLGHNTEAHSVLDQLDVRLNAAKIGWFRPEWWALRARLALAKGDAHAAEKSARLGLGAVDDRGDGQQLATLYRTLAAALEQGNIDDGTEDARDSRHRSLLAAQTRGAKVEQARSLFEIGLHYKLYASLPTRRARGSGYLYEADKMFQTMGLTMPAIDGALVPLL